jgi:hypothetical protein
MSQAKKQQLGYYAMAAFGALFIFAAGYFLAVKPAAGRASTLEARLTQLESEEALAAQSYNDALSLSKVQLADLFDLTRAMPDEAQVSEVLVVIGRLAENSNVRFTSLKPAQPVPLAGYQALPMELKIEGNFYDLMEFLYEIRHLVDVRGDSSGTAKLYATGRLFAINKIDVAILSAGDLNKPQLTATLALDAFTFGTGSGTPASAPPATTTTAEAATAAAPPAEGE